MTVRVIGDTNDYCGKGLSGAKVIVRPPEDSPFVAHENIIAGNVCFYGGTAGEAYLAGVAGERFCVRNSGVSAVVEGLGDHGCEYMTGGRVASLGPVGRNFGAGMSGGVAYVIDEDGLFSDHFNDAIADLMSIVPGSKDESELKEMIENHITYTGSNLGSELLANWSVSIKKFKKILPRDYARVIRERAIDSSDASGNTTGPKEGIGSRG